MTREEFKARWESNDNGGGITYDDIARCAVEWGISATPRIKPIDVIRYKVLVAANVVDANDYHPSL